MEKPLLFEDFKGPPGPTIFAPGPDMEITDFNGNDRSLTLVNVHTDITVVH